MKTREATLATGTTTVGAAKALGAALWTLPERIADALYEWQRRASERHHLRQLNDHMLKDIGLSRADVEGEAGKPFWTP